MAVIYQACQFVLNCATVPGNGYTLVWAMVRQKVIAWGIDGIDLLKKKKKSLNYDFCIGQESVVCVNQNKDRSETANENISLGCFK